MLRRHWVLAALALFPLTIVFASDVEKEGRWAEQIVDALIEGDAVWLYADGHEFLGIYMEAAVTNSKFGAIILHGIGAHPDWQQVVYPLRTRLPSHGWRTLSLQMPILPNDARMGDYAALMTEVPPRIDAGVGFFKEQGVEIVVIVSHSLGSTMAVHYLLTGDREIQGFVAIGMSRGILRGGVVNAQIVTEKEIPLLDLHGSEDSAEVLSAVSLREQLHDKEAVGGYRSRVVEGANHFFEGKDDALATAVIDWLSGTFPKP